MMFGKMTPFHHNPSETWLTDCLTNLNPITLKLTRVSDLATLMTHCFGHFTKIHPQITTFAIHRLISHKNQSFQSFRYQANNTVEQLSIIFRPTLYTFIQKNEIRVENDLRENAPELLNGIRKRFHHCPLCSLIDIPFSNGILSVHSIHVHAFTPHIIDLYQKFSYILIPLLQRINDLENLALLQNNQETIDILGNDAGNVPFLVKQQQALLNINIAIQRMQHITDINDVMSVCQREISALGIPFEALAIQRVIDKKSYLFDCCEITPSYEFKHLKIASKSYYQIWKTDQPFLASNFEEAAKTLSQEDLARIKTRFGANIQSICQIPFPSGLVTMMSFKTQAFEDKHIHIAKQMAQALSLGFARLEDLEALEQQRAQSSHTDRLRALGQMAAGMSHTLSQPLQGVRATAETLYLGKKRRWHQTEEEMQEQLEFIIDQTDRMNHIIGHVREFARGAEQNDYYPIHVNQVIQDALTLLQTQFRVQGIDIVLDLSSNLPTISINPFALEEIVINLLLNARDAIEEKFTDQTSPYPPIQIRTRAHDTTVHIQISDQGIGMTEAIQERIFEPFFTTKPPNKGTGLGLAIVQSRIENFSGTLSIKTAPNQGTTVDIGFPSSKDTN